MAEQPGFWSAENFPYMPLLALGQTIPRGYQYQSQMTPYRRDARGDWGRALNESIDQFFAMYPQWQQQKRAFALQREQLARQRVADAHQAKLRPFELKQAEASQQLLERQMKMRENYPQMVKGLKVSDEIKSYLLTQTPEQGNKFLQTYYAHQFKPRTKFIKAGQPDSRGVVRRMNVQEKPDGTIIKAAVSPPKINVFPDQLFPGTDIRNESGVTVEIDPSDNSLSYPLEKPPIQDFITVRPGEKFPDGSTNNSARDQLYDLRSKRKIAHEGTSRPKNIVPIQGDNPLIGQLKNTFGEDWVNKMLPYLKEDRTYAKEGQPGTIVMPPGFEEINKELQQRRIAQTAPTPTQLFQTKHSQNQYANIRSYADLADVAGTSLDAQRLFAIQTLPADHEVSRRAQYDLKQKRTKMGRNGIFIPEPFRPGPKGQKRSTASAPKSTPVNQGDTLDEIVERFKKQNITVNKSQVIAANRHFFPEGDENKMKTSTQVGGAEMLIPVGGGQLSETDINAAHRSNEDPRHDTTVIRGSGTYTNFNTTTVPFQYKLNNDLADMKTLQSNVDEVVELMKDPNAISLLKTGHPARGLIEGLRWRLINNVQTLRDFGVLSPSEIDTIAKSVPDPNSFFNIVAGKVLGLKPERFVEGVLGALKKEGETKASRLRAFMAHWNVPEIDFKIHRYDPYAGQQGQQENIFKEQDSLEYID